MLSLGAKRYNVNIPQGIRLGQKIRMRNVAHHIDPVLSGDIHLLVSANDKPIYRVKRDVLLDLPIDIRGLTSDVLKRVTIEGKLFDVKIPGDATSGTRITLKNRAVITNGGYPGDIIIRVVNMSRRSWSWSGIFEQFGSYGPSKFSVKFTLPWLFEIGGEWDFKKSFTEVHMGK